MKIPPPTPGRIRTFAFGLGAVLAVLGGLYLRAGVRPAGWTLAGVAATLVLAGAVCPAALKAPYTLWMYLGAGIGLAMSRLLLTVFYYLVITPVAAAMALFGRDRLELRRGRHGGWLEARNDDRGKRRYHSQFGAE